MIDRKSIGSQLIHVSQNYLTQILNIVFILLLTSKVTPEQLGLYGVVRSLFGLLEYSHLGSRFGLDIAVPKANQEIGKRYSKVVLQVGLIISVVAAGLFSSIYQSKEVYYYLGGGVLFYLGNNVRLFYRANGDVSRFIRKSLYQNIIPATLQLLGLLFFGFEGVFVGFLIASVSIVWLNKQSLKSILDDRIFKKADFWELQDKGKALLATSLLGLSVTVLDRLIVERFFGLEFTGFFTLIGLCVSSFAILPNSISELAISSIVKNSGNLKKSKAILKKNIGMVTIGTLLLVVASFFLIEPAVELFFDQYRLIIPELKLSLLSVLPIGASFIFQYYLVALGKNRQIVLINVFAFAIYYLGLFCAIKFGGGTVLMALVINKIIYAFTFFSLIFYIFKRSLRLE